MISASPLAERLKQRIRCEGPITVAAFMEACLTDERAGYYQSRQAIGASGDFITAPEISQVYGELLGAWCVDVWRGMDAPNPVAIVELGPGRGTLLSDALRVWRAVPGFLSAVRLHLVESSRLLRDLQAKTLAGAPVPIVWHDGVTDLPRLSAIVLASEFFDALPIHQLVRKESTWQERCVGLDQVGQLAFIEGPLCIDSDLISAELTDHAEHGDILEIRPAADTLLATLASRLNALALLIADYGHAESGFGDTLQGVSAHRYAAPLERPGEIDLTAHVDFAALKRSAERLGLKTWGPMAQGHFLLKLGLAERCEALLARARPAQREAIITGAARLADPRQMGALFKVLVLTSSGLPAPPPFLREI